MSPAIKNEIMKHVKSYGTGRDTLRCLALATIDNPPRREDMDLEDSRKFIQYEVKEFKLRVSKMKIVELGQVVQSIVSLTSWLRGQLVKCFRTL